jgi:hypothetical protein
MAADATATTTPTALPDLPDAVLVHILCLAVAAKHSAASAALSACRALAALPARAGDGADVWRALCAARGWDRADRLYTMPVLSLGDPWKAQFRAWRRRAFSSAAELKAAWRVSVFAQYRDGTWTALRRNRGGSVRPPNDLEIVHGSPVFAYRQRGPPCAWDTNDLDEEGLPPGVARDPLFDTIRVPSSVVDVVLPLSHYNVSRLAMPDAVQVVG